MNILHLGRVLGRCGRKVTVWGQGGEARAVQAVISPMRYQNRMALEGEHTRRLCGWREVSVYITTPAARCFRGRKGQCKRRGVYRQALGNAVLGGTPRAELGGFTIGGSGVAGKKGWGFAWDFLMGLSVR